jgi:transposase
MMLVREREGQAGNGAGRRCRRRVWSTEEKRRIVAESAAPGASVSVVARRHDINANMLFTWRRALGARLGVGSDPAAFVPAVMTAEEPASSPPASAHRERTVSLEDGGAALAAGRMEIVLGSGCRVIVDKHVSAPALARVIRVLERR